MINYEANHLLVIFPYMHSGNFIKSCFGLHDLIGDVSHKTRVNKAEHYTSLILNENAGSVSATNCHLGKVTNHSTTDLHNGDECEYYVHAWHSTDLWWVKEDMFGPDWTKDELEKFFINLKVIKIIKNIRLVECRNGDIDTRYLTDKISGSFVVNKNPFRTLNYSNILYGDLVTKLTEIAEQFNWPMVDNNILEQYINIYRERILKLK